MLRTSLHRSWLTVSRTAAHARSLSRTATRAARRPANFDEENESRDANPQYENPEEPTEQTGPAGRDLRPTVTQLRVAEMVRRIIQRAILTGHFDSEKIDLRDVGFDIEDVHMSKDLGRATVFWNAIDLETKSELIQETIQRSVRILTHVVGNSLQLCRIPLLVFRHAGMVTEDEEKRLRGRAGSRPGDVLRMYRMFTALRHDPDRLRSEEFLRSTLSADALKNGLAPEGLEQAARGKGKKKDKKQDEEAEGAGMDEFDDAEEDEHGLVPRAGQAPLDEVWREEQADDLHPDPMTQSTSAKEMAQGVPSDGREGRVSMTEAELERRAREQQRVKEDRLVAILKESLRGSTSTEPQEAAEAIQRALSAEQEEQQDLDEQVQAAFEAEVEAAVSAEEKLAEQQMTLQLAKGAGVGRFSDHWARRDKRALPAQHHSREQEAKETRAQEARLLRRVLAEMHAEEQSQVADADAQAADWAREAQRDLVGGGIISREQVSEEISEADLEFSEDELAQADELRSLDEDADVPSPDVLAAMTGGTPVSRRQQTVVHDESAVDKNMRARFLSIARAQQIASSPVPGRPDIPIGGGQSRDWSDERGLTQAEAQLAQLQRSVDADRQPVEPTQNGKLSADQIRSLLSQSEQAEDNMVSFSGEETEFQAKRAPEEDSLDDGAAPSDDMAAHLRGLGKQHERDEFKSMAARAMMARSMADFDRVMLPSPAPAAAPTQPEQPVEPLPIETQPPVSPSRKPRLPIPSKFSAIKTWPRTSAHKRPL